MSQYSHFWNSWGISLLSLAELTGEPLLAEDACSKFEVAIELSSHSEPDWIYNFACAIDLLGALREEVALHEQAIELFTYVSEEDPTFYDVLVQQGISYMRLGDARESLAEYRKGAELFRRYLAEEKEDEYVWLELGICLLRQAALLPQEADEKSLSLAKNAFLNALSLGNSLAYYHLACLYAFQKNYSEAMEFLWKAEAENALPPLQDLLEEEALAPLVATRPFLQFLRDIVFTESDATPEEGEESLPQ